MKVKALAAGWANEVILDVDLFKHTPGHKGATTP